MIVSPITPHSKRLYSHRAGWGHLWSHRLGVPMAYDSDYSKADVIYLEHGMEFRPDSKGLNYFLKSEESYDKLAERLELLQQFSGRLVSLDIPSPLYGSRAKLRCNSDASARFKGLDFDRIDQVCQSAKTLLHSDLESDTLVLGDSHSISAWIPGAYIDRNDGKTLHGALKLGFMHWLRHYRSVRHLRTYFGNIDIRFHLARQPDPIQAAQKLARDYATELHSLMNKWPLESVAAVLALPIEDESRVLPKTGYYKGQPFYGNWELRNQIRQAFNYELSQLVPTVGWPQSFQEIDGKLSFDVMEKPRSVHISPEFYMWRVNGTRNSELGLPKAA